MNSKFLAATAAACLSMLPVAAQAVTAQDLLNGWNNIVLNDLQANAETEGTLFVGNDYTGGATVNPDNEPGVDLGNGLTVSLAVGGDVTSTGLNVNNGDVAIGGANNTANTNGGTVTAGVAGIPTAQYISTFQTLSAELNALSDTGGTANTSDQNNINFQSVAGPDGIAVFHIDGSVLANGTFNGISAPSGVTTIINVSGTAPTIGVNGNFTDTMVLFNFYEATSLNIQSAFNYSILAPLATVTLNGGGINGTVVSYNLTQNAEIRPAHFQGNLPSSASTVVPIPGAAGLLLSALVFGGIAARRRTA